MRIHDDPIDVRKGEIPAFGEGPEQFLWRDRLWQVRAVISQWVETGQWWQGANAGAVDLLTEREIWRVEAARPGLHGVTTGVFDLTLDWDSGSWRLTGCLD